MAHYRRITKEAEESMMRQVDVLKSLLGFTTQNDKTINFLEFIIIGACNFCADCAEVRKSQLSSRFMLWQS